MNYSESIARCHYLKDCRGVCWCPCWFHHRQLWSTLVSFSWPDIWSQNEILLTQTPKLKRFGFQTFRLLHHCLTHMLWKTGHLENWPGWSLKIIHLIDWPQFSGSDYPIQPFEKGSCLKFMGNCSECEILRATSQLRLRVINTVPREPFVPIIFPGERRVKLYC